MTFAFRLGCLLRATPSLFLLTCFALLLPACRRPGPPGVGASRCTPNVLLITLDTTRADRLGCYGYAEASTPHIDRLAAAGVRFDRALTHVPLTLPAHASLLTGVHPPTHSIRVNAGGILPRELPLLAESFELRGYRTGAFVSAWVLNASFGLARGFDTYDDRLTADGDEDAKERPADRVTSAALDWLQRDVKTPFFAWVHYYDPHHPYEPPEPYRSQHDDPYDGEIAFVDAELGRLLDWVEQPGRREHTIIIVVGDHGEAFGEHDEPQHGLFVYNTTMLVPLILVYPNVLQSGHVVKDAVGLVDIVPTILALLGWPTPASTEGSSLVEACRGGEAVTRAVYAECQYPRLAFGWAGLRAVTAGQWKYIEAPRGELYDLESDPAETTNVLEEHPEVVGRLRDELARLEAAMTPGDAAVVLDAQTLRGLESLGYVGAAGKAVEDPDRPRRDPKDMVPVYRGLMRARHAAQLGRPQDVVAIIEPLTAISPQSDELYALLGEAYLKLGRFAAAERAYVSSMRNIVKDPARWCGLGDAQRHQGHLDDAIESYLQALVVTPDYGQAHSRLGLVYAEREDFTRAEGHFRRYLAADPESPNALSNLANVLMAQQRPAEAAPLLGRALRIDPDYAPAHRVYWIALLQTGQNDAALTALRAACSVLPDDPELHRQLERLEVAMR